MAEKRDIYVGFKACGCAVAICVANEAGTGGAEAAGYVIPNQKIAEMVSEMILNGYAVERRDSIPEGFNKGCPHIQPTGDAGDTEASTASSIPA